MTKREAIVEMLKRYVEARETLNGPQESFGDGENLALMPLSWNASFRELERCLKILRAEYPNRYWHVRERYISPVIVVIDLGIAKNGKIKHAPNEEIVAGAATAGERIGRFRVRRWNPDVDERKVSLGVDYLIGEFRGTPDLSRDMWNAVVATGSAIL